jgi:menaquinone-specific isochorismate synthase
MSYETWREMIESATQAMRTSELNKVVLSRVCELRFEERVDVDGALSYLNATHPDCHRFLFEPRPYHAFYGATPEMLARVDGLTLTTMGLAGSIRRGQTAVEDDVLAQELLTSQKDLYEHAVVVDSIQRRLEPVVSELTIAPKPGVLRLGYIQHLYTPVYGRLHHPTGILPITEILHPTPALGGTPRHLALPFISTAEPVPRGWYAAPVGWLDRHLDGEFAVAIRSAIAQDRRVWLHAGAGIVADSNPQKEWEETQLKFRPMLSALGIMNCES